MEDCKFPHPDENGAYKHVSTLTLKSVYERGGLCEKTDEWDGTLDMTLSHAYIAEEVDNQLPPDLAA